MLARGLPFAEFDFSRVFDSSPNASAVIDRDLRLVAANHAYLKALGLRWPDIVGRSLFDVLASPGTEQLRASFERVIASGHRDDLPFVNYTRERTFSSSTTPILGDTGEVGWILNQIADVTELRGDPDSARIPSPLLERMSFVNAELALLKHVFEQAPGFACFLSGPEHRCELANPGYFELIGRNRSVLGKPIADALPEVIAQGFVELLDRVYTTGVAHVGRATPVLLARPSGNETRILDFVYQPIVVDGQSVGVMVQGNDITDVRNLESKYQQLVQIVPQQVWSATPDGKLDSVNEVAVEYFGKPVDQLVGGSWEDLIHPEDVELTRTRWLHSLATGESYQNDFRLRRNDGAYHWYLARAIAVRAEDGRIRSWIGTNTDIDKARRDHDELARRAAYEEKLIGVVSHDLRNPLGTITLAVSMLERDELSTAGQKAIGYIKAASARSERLIGDLLDFAQARSGSFPIHRGPTDLSALCRAAVENAKLATGPRAVTLVHRGPATGRWDEGRLTQVVANLVGNAFQHAPPEAVIRVTSAIENDRATIAIFNEGSPIAADDLPRMFDPFARGKNAKTKQGKSVGLGLYIARQITLAHGGEIAVTSDASGTTFTVTLPLELTV
ncbi:MAG TPA: PAS domain-containing protein [Kofleriaceae bacterium]